MSESRRAPTPACEAPFEPGGGGGVRPVTPPEQPGPAFEETLASREAGETIEPPQVQRTSSIPGPAEAGDVEALHLPRRATIRRPPTPQDGPTFLTGPRRAPGVGARSSSPSEENVYDGEEGGPGRAPGREPAPAPAGPLPDAGGPPDFVLGEVIGVGGQAEIWRAFQPSLDREIALKVLHADERPGHVVRFLQEAYTSAALDHPNIAPIYELSRARLERGECTQLAMKLIRGRTWNELLREERARDGFTLDAYLARHLAIFVSVCHAVAYAHSKRILHRDLKPKQVVVGEYGEVYLLDWGLALSLDDQVPSVDGRALPKFRTRGTATNRSGTPAYMAPEQTDPTTARLGFATDIYLLGGILHEIVAGRPPHAGDTASAAYTRAQHNECEPLPPTAPPELRATIERALATEPSARHASVADLREEVEAYLTGAGRQKESRELTQLAREWLADRGEDAGYDIFVDLEKILTRALQLWPNNAEAGELRQAVQRRHAAQALRLGDLELARSLAPLILEEEERHALLDDVARAAARHRALDRRRRRLEFASATLALTLLYAVVVGAILHARGQADAARALDQQEQADLFRRINRLRDAEQGLAAELRLLLPPPQRLTPTADLEPGDEPALAPLLARRALLARERAALAGDPRAADYLGRPPFDLLLAGAHIALGRAVGSGDALAAYDQYEAAHHARPESPEPLTGMGIAAARGGFPSSATLHLADATARARAAYGARSREVAEALALEAAAWQALNDQSPDYVRLYEDSLAILEPEWGRLSLVLADRYQELGRFDRALDYSSPALALYERAPAGDGAAADLAAARLRVGGVLMRRGDYPGARALIEQGLDLRREALGPEHPDTSEALLQLADLEQREGRHERAEELLRAVIAERRARLGDRHPLVAEAMDALSMALGRSGRHDEAEELCREALEVLTAVLGERHPRSVQALNNLATLLERAGRHDEATPLLRRSLTLHRENYGDDHPALVAAHNNLAFNLDSLGHAAEAAASYSAALALGERVLGPRHPYVGAILGNYATNLVAQERDAEALALMRRALAIKEQSLGAGHSSTLYLHNNIAFVAARAGDHAVALHHYLRALRGYRAQLGDADRSTALMFSNVAWTAVELGRLDDADVLLRASLRLVASAFGPDHPYVYSTARRIHRVGAMALAAAPDRHADAAAVALLHRGAWLDRELPRYRPTLTRAQAIDDLLGGDEATTSAALALDPPRRDLAARRVARAAAVASLLDLPSTHPLRVRFLVPRAADLAPDLALLAPASPDRGAEPPDALAAAARAGEPLATADLLAWLANAAPDADVGRDADLPGAPHELADDLAAPPDADARLAEVLDRLEALAPLSDAEAD